MRSLKALKSVTCSSSESCSTSSTAKIGAPARVHEIARRDVARAAAARLREGLQQVGLAGAGFAPQVHDAVGELAAHGGLDGVSELGIAAGDEVREGWRGRLGEIEEELPHGFHGACAPRRSPAAGLARARPGTRAHETLERHECYHARACLRIDAWLSPLPSRSASSASTATWASRPRSRRACVSPGEKPALHRAREAAPEGTRRGAGRALLRPPRPAGPRAGDAAAPSPTPSRWPASATSIPAKTIVVAGVRFMGETAKILNPEKRVLMPDLEAECSLDLATPIEPFSKFCDEHPDRVVVVYANTSAAVKARSDWMVTSSIAEKIVGCAPCPGQEDPVGARQAPGRLRAEGHRRGHADVERVLRRARRVQGAAARGAEGCCILRPRCWCIRSRPRA